jgi:hypothetical protein
MRDLDMERFRFRKKASNLCYILQLYCSFLPYIFSLMVSPNLIFLSLSFISAHSHMWDPPHTHPLPHMILVGFVIINTWRQILYDCGDNNSTDNHLQVCRGSKYECWSRSATSTFDMHTRMYVLDSDKDKIKVFLLLLLSFIDECLLFDLITWTQAESNYRYYL